MDKELLERYRKYLTNAQVKELAAKAERYKLLNAQRRAEAQNSILAQQRQTRRGLQNVGLAGREGKVISGMETSRNDALEKAYGTYNRQLRKVEEAQTQNEAVRMANANIAAQRRAAEEAYQRQLEEQAQLQQQIAAQQTAAQQAQALKRAGIGNLLNKEVSDSGSGFQTAADEQSFYAYDPRKHTDAENIRYYQRVAQMNGLRGSEANTYALDKAREAGQRNAEYRAEGRAMLMDPTGKNRERMQGEIDKVEDFTNSIVLYKQYNEKLPEWERLIASEPHGEISPRDSVAKGNKKKAEQARREMAQAQSKIARYSILPNLPADVGELVVLTDDDFDVRFDAAEKAYNRAMQEAKIARQDNPYTMDDLNPNGIERKAEEEFAKWIQAKKIRSAYSETAYYYDTFKTVDAAKKYDSDAKEGDYTVDVKAYDREHGTEDSKYAAIVNELSKVLTYTDRAYRYTFRGKADNNPKYQNFEERIYNDRAYDIAPDEPSLAGKHEKLRAVMVAASYMTDDERARYNSILYQDGADTADKYFEYLYETVLVDRVSQAIDEDYDATLRRTTKYDEYGNRIGAENGKLTWLGQVGTSVLSVPMNILEGVMEPINSLMQGQRDPVAARLAAVQGSSAQGMRNAVQENYGKVGQFLYGAGMSMADSATVAVISGGIGNALQGLGVAANVAGKIGSVLGGSILGGSAFNTSYEEALQRGLSPDKARATAFGNGVNEMLFEALSLDMLVGHYQKGGILKVSKNGFVNWLVNTMVQGGVEGSEEFFTDMANNLWDKKVNGIYAEELTKLREYISQGMSYADAKRKVNAEFAAQLGMSFLGGFVSGGVMGGGATFMGMVNTRQLEKYGKSLRTDTKAMDKLTSFDYKSKEAQEILKQGKMTNTDVGTLAVIRDQELTQQAHDYVAKLVKDGKISADVQKLIDKFIDNPGLVESKNGGLADFNGKEVFTAQEVAQIAPHEKYLQNAIDIRGDAKALMEARQAQEEKLDNPLITNEERAKRIGQEFGTGQRGVREQIAGDLSSQRAGAEAARSMPNVNKSVIEGMKLKDAVTVKGNKVDTKKGAVTFDYGSSKTTDTMTNDQLIALRYAQGMADITGSNIKVESEFVGKDKNADGFYNPDTDTVHINLKGKNSMVYTLAHELTHRIAKLNKAAYADLLKAVKEELSRSDLTGDALPEVYQEAIGKYMDGETSLLDALRKYEKEHYARNGIILDKDGGTKEVDEEIVCKCCETFLADPRFVQNMVTKHKTGVKAVYSFLKDVYNDMKALFGLAERNADEEGKGNAANISAESDILAQFGNIDRIFKLWARAVKQMQKQTVKTTANADIKARISDTFTRDVEEWNRNGMRYDTKNATVTTDVATAIEDNGVVVDKQGEPVLKVHDHGDGGVQYSYSTWKKEGRDTLKAFMKKDTENYAKKRRKELRESGMSKAEVKAIVDSEVADMRTQYERIMKQMDKIYDISEKYLDKYASFGTWSRADVTVDKDGKPVFSVIRANGEYPMNIDFSLVCVKRRALDAVLNEIVRRGFMEKLVLDGESLVKVNEIIRKRGFEIACMGCFVEAKRFRQQGVAEGFAEKYNEIVKSLGGEAAYANFGQDESVKRAEGITGKKDSELNWSRVNELIDQYNKKKAANSRAGMTVEEAIAFELKENPKSRVLLKSGDFMSTRGMDRVAEVAPSILTLYNKQKGTGGPKAVFGDMQYLNDVCKKQWNVNKAYAVGGVRVQSFSDFVPRMFFDYCQMIADLATRKLPAHAYTKEESFVRLYGLTGMKINMSLFPKVGNDGLSAGLQYMRDKNGDIVYTDGKPVKTYAWAGESFNYDVAKEIQADAAYGKNCGTIAVGISDEQIRMMMADPTIRMIIPYHKSSLNPVIAEMMGIQGFTDYTEYQRTKLDGKAIDVDFAFNQRLHEVGDPQAVVKEYLDWCKENGYTAKFEQFAYNADGSINENYYKLLEDFTLFDEQGNYCPQEAVQMVYPKNMDALLDKYLKQDSDMQEARDAMIPAVADEIIRAMDRKASMSNTDFKTDKLGGQEYLKYLQLGTKVVNQTATEAEIKEFKQRMVQLSEDNRMAFLDKLREKMIRADEAAKVREVRDRQIARLKEEFRESKEKARERRVRSDLTATLKKGNDRIVQLLSRPTENAHVPVQLAQAVSEYAMRLNQLLTTSEPKTGEFAGMEKQTQKGALNAQKILDALKRSYADKETIEMLKAEDPKFDPRGLIPVQFDENGKMIKDDSLAEMVRGMDEIIQGKHLNELTTDELRYVMNTMRGVIYAVTEANKVTVDGESRNVYRTSRKMANEVKSASKVFGDKSNAITKFLNRYVIESLGLRRIAKLYSGSNENATFVKLVDDLNEGAIEQERIKQTLRNMFNDVTQKYEKDMKTWYGKNAEWIDTGFGFKITKGMRVSLAMHILNEQNLRNVEKAGLRIPEQTAYRKGNYKEAYKNGKVYRLTKAQAEQIVANMTEAEKAYFEVAKEFFHKQSGKYINRTSLKLLGFSKAIVDNYFPIQTDDAYRTVKYDDVRQNGSVEHPGFLETRNGTANVMYLNDITAVVNRQIEGVAKYAGLAIPMRNWNNVMNAWLFEENENGEWVRSDEGRPHDVLERRMGYTNGKGKAVMDYVDQFISDLTSPGMRDANENVQAAEFAAKITSNYVKAVLTLNARVALSQLASVPTAAAEIPWKYIVQSFGGNVEERLNRNASNELIDMYTPIFAMRRVGTQTEVSEVMKRKGFADKAEQKLPGLLGWITAMDTAATRRLWYACERWVKGETDIPVGSDAFYKEVAKRYERVIQNTQPNFTVLQRSPALRSKNAAARIITMFGTQRMQNGGILIESVAEVAQAKDAATRKAALKKFGRALSGQITAAIVLGVSRAIVAALRGRMKPLQDEDKEITFKSVDKYIRGEVATSLAGSFMYVGELYDFVHGIVSGITEGDPGYDQSFALPAAEALSTLIGFFRDKDWQYFKYMQGDHTDHEKWLKTKSFINELMTAASYATGLPLQNASKTILNGWLPLGQDIADAIKTGEFIPYLNQSGKLDSSTTAANYKEWTNDGKKGSTYLYWENVAKNLPKEKDTGYPKSEQLASKLMADRELTPEEKATLYRMLGGDLVQEGSVVYHPLTVNQKYLKGKEHGTIAVDFTNYSRYQMSQMDDAKYNGFLKAVEMGVPEDLTTTAYRNYASAKKYETRRGVDAKDSFHDWLFKMVSDPAQRAILDMQVVGSAKSVKGSIGYKENGDVYADYSSRESFDAYTKGTKKTEKAEAVGNLEATPQQKAEAFASMYGYTAKDGIVYNDKGVVQADYTSDEAYTASQMGEAHYKLYTDAVMGGMSRGNAIKAVEMHKEIMTDEDKDNATQAVSWIFKTYTNANDRAIAGTMFTTKTVTVKDGRTYDENGYIYRDYTSVAWYKLSNRNLSKDGKNKRYETAQTLTKQGYTAEQVVATYVDLDKLSKKTEWQKYLKDNGFTDDQINLFLWSKGWAK